MANRIILEGVWHFLFGEEGVGHVDHGTSMALNEAIGRLTASWRRDDIGVILVEE